ncbi:hypothetical protein DEO72_LG9g1995 [Vigna unguiculata]|uniref:Uncharacterized protein n=1 Tax=Vigna unguiculata TaxID=3917 RepID=A0A4D6MZI0_VIGUN|nr:hypothetical protein DEO72_LG9g1995 [Vigna unguiculata]
MLPSCFTLSSPLCSPLRSLHRSRTVRALSTRRLRTVCEPSARCPLVVFATRLQRCGVVTFFAFIYATLARLDALKNDNAGFEIEDANNDDDEASLDEQDQC